MKTGIAATQKVMLGNFNLMLAQKLQPKAKINKKHQPKHACWIFKIKKCQLA
jgi:hypothetical protein